MLAPRSRSPPRAAPSPPRAAGPAAAITKQTTDVTVRIVDRLQHPRGDQPGELLPRPEAHPADRTDSSYAIIPAGAPRRWARADGPVMQGPVLGRAGVARSRDGSAAGTRTGRSAGRRGRTACPGRRAWPGRDGGRSRNSHHADHVRPAARRVRLCHVPRLRTVSPKDPGWTRRRAGKGFVYLDQPGARLAAEDAERCKLLVIPPAWEQVWICPRAERPHAGGRHRRRRAAAVHLPRAVAASSGTSPSTTGCSPSPPGCPPRATPVANGSAAGRDAVRAGPGHRVPAARPRFLPDRRRGVRGGQQLLRARHHPARSTCPSRGRRGVRLRRQVGPGALRRAGRRPGPAGRTRPAAAARAAGRSCWRTEDGEDLARRHLDRHQRLHQGEGRARRCRPRTSAPGTAR